MLKDWMYDPWRRFALLVEGDPGGGGSPPADPPALKDPPADSPEPKTYDEAYVKKLRDEAAANRVKNKELEAKMAILPQETTAKILQALGIEPDPKLNFEKQVADAQAKAQAAETRANERLVKAEVKTLAVSMQIIDPDAAFLLIDRTNVKITDAGEVEGAKEALEALVKAKPYLVGKGGKGGVGSGTNPGPGEPPDPVAAAKKYAEERNKKPEVQGGFDPWARK
jgi:hypothetical protein